MLLPQSSHAPVRLALGPHVPKPVEDTTESSQPVRLLRHLSLGIKLHDIFPSVTRVLEEHESCFQSLLPVGMNRHLRKRIIRSSPDPRRKGFAGHLARTLPNKLLAEIDSTNGQDALLVAPCSSKQGRKAGEVFIPLLVIVAFSGKTTGYDARRNGQRISFHPEAHSPIRKHPGEVQARMGSPSDCGGVLVDLWQGLSGYGIVVKGLVGVQKNSAQVTARPCRLMKVANAEVTQVPIIFVCKRGVFQVPEPRPSRRENCLASITELVELPGRVARLYDGFLCHGIVDRSMVEVGRCFHGIG
ncbi:hypothetical protein NEUTE1DRAFT_103489 [Neurospora tetrasperma FGSC 2508]|uniref:Uncharacterized protein n=1 Tax=Neurospora tetrasperma (strain FGSC 2508 / ATCC MYA-4615 / P0657) TaxID=510951 RepID=F8MVT8_NEUT8|nr:uncharacterized protein NEUTE1DRAFT_103489 [Neurospora tetrasperma FGSC 2508]EGO53986.1 hypothetical protein NEUTE1DRAFT_103489 [Neurospora tetrasperma FGSC 2508]